MDRLQTIQIFLPDGSPRSVKIAEITNRVVKAILAPPTPGFNFVSTDFWSTQAGRAG